MLCKNNTINFKNIHRNASKDEFETINSEEIMSAIWTKPVLLLLVGMFGNDHIDNFNYQILKRLMQHKSCVGFIGGVKNQAYYIVGQHRTDMIILDPHQVNVTMNRSNP